MRIKARLAGEAAEVESVAATRIENHVAGLRAHDLGDLAEQRLGYAAIVQSPARRHGSHGITWMLRSPLLRLKEVDVAATGNVERMTPRTTHAPLYPLQGQLAVAYGAQEHDRL
jgi:hypothetical protein